MTKKSIKKNTKLKLRAVVELNSYDRGDISTYDGYDLAIVRDLKKSDDEYFERNCVSILSKRKTIHGFAYEIPYVKIDDTKYWIVDNLQKSSLIQKNEWDFELDSTMTVFNWINTMFNSMYEIVEVKAEQLKNEIPSIYRELRGLTHNDYVVIKRVGRDFHFYNKDKISGKILSSYYYPLREIEKLGKIMSK